MGSFSRSASGIFSLIVKHSQLFFAVLDFLGCANYPRSAKRCYVYASPIGPLPCPLSSLLLRVDILQINFMSHICKMYIIIRMRRNLRLIDVFGLPWKFCLLNPSLVCNFCLYCLVIRRLERSLCGCCDRWLISISMPYIMSIWWHLMISLMQILVIFVNDLALQPKSDTFIGAHL
jgi:hypothetical protein